MIPLRSRSDSWTFTPEPHAIRIESNFSRCPIVQRRNHYSHAPYRKVKNGLNSATAIRPADSTRILPIAHRQPSTVFRHDFQRSRSSTPKPFGKFTQRIYGGGNHNRRPGQDLSVACDAAEALAKFAA